MKVGVFLALFGGQTLEKALDYVIAQGLDTVEVGAGNYPGDPHCKPSVLLKDATALEKFKKTFADKGITISALSCHANPLHPNKAYADAHRKVQRETILLAEKLGIRRVITFSGCPGGGPDDKVPNWITCPWPDDFSKAVAWQWEERVFPFWTDEAKFAKDHGVKVCLEMHPGFVVYNPETMMKLRKEAGPMIGANFDPSHLFWQGIDPIVAVKNLGKAIFHVHAKDTRVDPQNTAADGVLDVKSYGDEINRAWVFRTVGYGHGPEFWKDFVSTLRLVGYDDVLSIEHEDSLMSVNEGFTKAVQFLKGLVLEEKRGAMWWA
ncbi:MAG TPA: sugar phosphate isomerase/epimerase [bacterium]|nr:sugar phosphate isomerase/epimerase [bacterium]